MTKILIVDDNTLNLDILKDALKDEYKLAFAKNGKMALKVMQKNIPDLILLDIMMPVMDGYETYKALKADEQLHNIPVIFLTGLDDVDRDLIEVSAHETIVHLKKPFDIRIVKNTICDILSNKEVS